MNPALHVRAQTELATIYEISKILTSSLDLAKTCREALNVLANNMGYRRCMIVADNEDGDLHLLAAVGLSPEEYQAGHYHPGEGVIGKVFSSGMPAVVQDLAAEPFFLNRTGALDHVDGERIALVGMPVRVAQQVVGVITIDRVSGRNSGGFNEDVRLLTMVASLVGQALALQRTVVAERNQLLSETRRLRHELKGRFRLDNVIDVSKRMQDVFAEVHQAGPSRSTVLLRGESGTGKEVIARALHTLSPRKDGPFIKVNCAALTESLLESELFGHEKGSFTGAVGERKGRFEMADKGTLFLDEIGDISPAFQAKLLRVLQEREFERVGGNRSIKVDVRLVCATNRNLEKMVAAGEFRSDLYYRINVVSIFLPPLRERREDIPPLIAHFIERFNSENNRDLRVSAEALDVLTNCFWPGNVRELENCIERTATMARGDTISDLHFPCHNNRCLTQSLHHVDKDDAVSALPAHAGPVEISLPIPEIPHRTAAPERQFGSTMPEGERERLIWAMEHSGWVQARAARLLNITPRQMGYALQKYDIEVKRF
ncbi:MAG: nif-specific transcriptional activator NifA [Zoogloea sp.]|uniref:nif-specific transcriptional activator NifA n=1 Tax=Zoogloea sp. TaxID=49181 RepID=UPI002632B4CC|nr:nif-specific transcriptional activator NifA [Zoogloea sp.]MDD3329468.1 nif-specific transcriptional activator NifA [Zoogloea sp.]